MIFESLATPLSTGHGTRLLASTSEKATRKVVEKIDLEITALFDALIIVDVVEYDDNTRKSLKLEDEKMRR